MTTTKVAIAIDSTLLQHIDQLVAQKIFSSRNRVVQEALQAFVHRQDRSRLARECVKLDIAFEQAMANDKVEEELTQWPTY